MKQGLGVQLGDRVLGFGHWYPKNNVLEVKSISELAFLLYFRQYLCCLFRNELWRRLGQSLKIRPIIRNVWGHLLW